ncbi:MAG: M1 family aminopeptidase [Bacteroidia bacterium]
MKFNKILLQIAVCYLLLVQTKIAFAQLPQVALFYQSAENKEYWKNRKPHAAYWQQDVHYTINALLIDSLDIIDAEETLYYVNNSPDTLTQLYFHLYQNAFIKGSYLEQLNLLNKFKQHFGRYEKAGKGTEIENLTVNDKQADLWLDNTILRVIPQNQILPGSITTIKVKFKTYFDDGGNQRRRMKMFKDAWGNKQFNAVHWYPRICVYDHKFKWATDQHLSKEFYGNFGTFQVSLNIPNHYIVDATGELQNAAEVMPENLRKQLDIKNFAKKPWEEKPSVLIEPNGTFKKWNFTAVNVHDFAWVADPTFRIGEEELTLKNGHKVKLVALAQEPHTSGWQDAALFTKRVIEVYSRDFGNYIYPKMICVDARDGMEYPMLTLDGGRSPGYYGLIAHEVGHNWFFGMVGNNETYRASLDEGFTQFLTHWATLRILGENKLPAKRKGYRAKFARTMPSMDAVIYNGYFRDAIQKQDKALNTHSDDFDNALHHGGGYGNVYYKTATMLYNLQYVLGEDLFLRAMQHYFNRWKLCHPYFEDFRESIIDYTKVDLNWFFDQWLETTKHTDYAIKKVKTNNNNTSITLKRKSEMQMPLDVTVIFKDSSVQQYIIPNKYFVKQTNATVLPYWLGWGKLNTEYSFNINTNKKVSNVIIDPTYRLADVYQLDNSWKKPVVFSFDHQLRTPPDRRNYYLKWRPDVWYNAIDGIKAGVHFNGNYYNLKHVLGLTVWFNTFSLNTTQYGEVDKGINRINYNFNYSNLIGYKATYFVNSRFLDGLFANTIGIEKGFGKNYLVRAYFKSLYRQFSPDLHYVPLHFSRPDVPESRQQRLWQSNMFNNTFNVILNKNYQTFKSSGQLQAAARTSALFSDYGYASTHLLATNFINFGKFELRSRFYWQLLTQTGSIKQIVFESMLYASGANPEEYMDNKYVRSIAFLPFNWFGFGNVPGNFQLGGGLNLRGYAGYVLPVNNNNVQQYLFFGNHGSSINVELDFDKYIKFAPSKLAPYLHLDTYLFADAGFVGNSYNIGKTNALHTYSGLLADAGIGIAATIKKWGFLDEPKPLTIRFDMPMYLSNAPFAEPENFKFRWVLGIGRTF